MTAGRSQSLRWSALVASSIVTIAPTAGAAAPLALDRFQPAPAGDPLLGVESAAMGRGLAIAAIGTYARAPYVEARTGERVVSAQLVLHANVGVSVAERLKLDLDLPFVVAQDGDASAAARRRLEPPSGGAASDTRLGARVLAFRQSGDVPAVAIGFRAYLPSGRPEQYSGTGDARYEPAIIVSAEHPRFVWSAVFSRTWRSSATTVPAIAGSEIAASAGGAIKFGPIQLGPEVYASTVADAATSAFGRDTTNVEALLGARWLGRELSASLAAGPGLTSGIGTPTYRILLGVTFAPELASPPPVAPSVAHGAPPPVAPEPSPAPRRASSVASEPEPKAPPAPLEKAPPPPPAPAEVAPTATETARIAGSQIVISKQIVFGRGKETIEAESGPVLEEIARILAAHPDIVRVAVDGHTDDKGAADANTALSQRRAVAVVRALVARGVDSRRLESRAFGPRRPIADNATDAGRAQNRRVEFQIRKRSAKGAEDWTDGSIE